MVAQHVEDNRALDLSRLPSGRLQNSLRLQVFHTVFSERAQTADSSKQQGG
jgi:hypothetical protein